MIVVIKLLYIYIYIYMYGPWAQNLIIYPYIVLVAQVENKNLPEEEKSSSEEIALINKRWDLIVIASESVPRMKTSSARLG